jgi:hypothetical protein
MQQGPLKWAKLPHSPPHVSSEKQHSDTGQHSIDHSPCMQGSVRMTLNFQATVGLEVLLGGD